MNIYKILHTASGRSYIGKNTNKDPEFRWKRHQRRAFQPRYSTYDSYFHRAIRKYSPEAFLFSSLASTESKEELSSLETKFILELKTNEPEHGFNSTTGGEAVIYSPTARKNMSDAQKWIWANSPERRKEVSRRSSGENNNFFGTDHSGSNNGFFGKKHTVESLKHMSESRTGIKLGPQPQKSEREKRAWERDPERRKRQGDMARKRWSNPDFRKRMGRLFASKEFRESCIPHKITLPKP